MSGARRPKTWRRLFSWAAVLAWMALIFFMSARPYELSGTDSGRVAELIVGILESLGVKGRLNSTDTTLVLFVRKAGHFVEYAVLCLLVMNALVKSKQKNKVDKRTYRNMALVAMVLCVGFAITDEVHQYFVPGRSMRASDVVIDAASSASAILFYMRYIARRRNI
ncbi:MAG TPA: VanZ family protein [Bacillota bacterium]|nr:VanZ family protein [Bacillota bacterium]HOH09921.1 VanZ family protein [Bacillota bacterium]HOS50554.1 VanZ family protein [Bacillota bacterium]HOY89156.1 VanZ family protein [Bacillota bacterium]HPI01797.1 VanZ family protein [Bacillota bacterium]